MPKLKNFTAQLGGGTISGGRRATGEDFGAGIGTSLQQLGEQVQATGKQIAAIQENNEARTALVASTQIRAKYTELLNEASRTGADTDTLQEQMNNELSAVGDGFTTRRGVEALDIYTANGNLAFGQQANAILVRRASAEAKAKGNEWINAASAILRRDPTALAGMEQDASDFVESFDNIPPEQRKLIKQSLSQQLNMASVFSSARTDPAGTRARLEAGEWNLTPAQREQGVKETEFVERAIEAEKRAAEAERRRMEDEADADAMNEGVSNILNGDRPDLFDSRLKAPTRENLYRFMEAHNKEQRDGVERSNPTVKRDLWLRINKPDGDPKKVLTSDVIFEAVARGQLNTGDADKLISMMQANKDGQGTTFRQRLGDRIGSISRAMYSSPQYSAQPDLAAAIQNELLSRAEDRAEELRRKNKSPEAMLDSESKDYFFKPGLIKTVADDVSMKIKQEAWEKQVKDMPVVGSQADYDKLPPGPYVDANDPPGSPPRMKQGGQTRFSVPPKE